MSAQLNILVIDDNAMDNVLHGTLFNSMERFQTRFVPCSEYAIAHIESTLKNKEMLPSFILLHVDFHNQNDFETMYRYLKCRKKLDRIKLNCMSCTSDPRFFSDLFAVSGSLKVYQKPLTADAVMEMTRHIIRIESADPLNQSVKRKDE